MNQKLKDVQLVLFKKTMKATLQLWSIRQLNEEWGSITPKPQYQRTPVWTFDRKAYLIDSILRGYDIPKFYVNQKRTEFNEVCFDVVDGQQRMRAIIGFLNDEFPLQFTFMHQGIDYKGEKFSALPMDIQESVQNYDLNFTEIYESSPGEINDLFTRLQKGVSLNPPELRHAFESAIGIYIEDFITQGKTKFFDRESGIVDSRFKHQDYIDHVICLIHNNGEKDLKAASMNQMYIEFQNSKTSDFKDYFDKATIILEFMRKMNQKNRKLLKNKWAFVDMFWILATNFIKIKELDPKQLSDKFREFENLRLMFKKRPEYLLIDETKIEEADIENNFKTVLKVAKNKIDIYNYIQAFEKEGANKGNILSRKSALTKILFSS